VIAPMINRRARSSYETDILPWSKAMARTTIWQALRAHYEIPQELPHGMLTLLMQLNGREEEE
jgi:hypothetical protein